MKIRIGTRGSRLALWQAKSVEEAIREEEKDARTELVILQTKGDRILDRPLSEIGDKGLFVSEFEQALSEGRIDLAVHSAKDLPAPSGTRLTISAVLPRGDARDVLLFAQRRKTARAGAEFRSGNGKPEADPAGPAALEGVSLPPDPR